MTFPVGLCALTGRLIKCREEETTSLVLCVCAWHCASAYVSGEGTGLLQRLGQRSQPAGTSVRGNLDM